MATDYQQIMSSGQHLAIAHSLQYQNSLTISFGMINAGYSDWSPAP
jgi:hypothetical protein